MKEKDAKPEVASGAAVLLLSFERDRDRGVPLTIHDPLSAIRF